MLALVGSIKILNDDDALELFQNNCQAVQASSKFIGRVFRSRFELWQFCRMPRNVRLSIAFVSSCLFSVAKWFGFVKGNRDDRRN